MKLSDTGGGGIGWRRCATPPTASCRARGAPWLRRRRARDFATVERFCLFVGYPRSGHSLVGALLNAHRDAVIAHELDVPPLIVAGCARDELYARILARARWFHLRGDRSNYAYRVPRQWQGRFAALHVIGDKRGGAVTRCIAAEPDFLERVRPLVGVPLRLIHVVRNPVRQHRRDLDLGAQAARRERALLLRPLRHHRSPRHALPRRTRC